MNDTPETDGITFFATKDMMPPYNTVPAEFARKLERERDQARRELDIQLESIKFHMERVPIREHPLKVDDAKLFGENATK